MTTGKEGRKLQSALSLSHTFTPNSSPMGVSLAAPPIAPLSADQSRWLITFAKAKEKRRPIVVV